MKIKKSLLLAALSIAACFPAFGGESDVYSNKPKLKPYGFIRNYMVFDTRENYAGTQDLYYYMPKDNKFNEAGEDLNANPSFRFLSLTTRLGLDVTGLQYGKTKMGGKIEADFYCMSGSVAVLRLRQAYMHFTWDNLGVSQKGRIVLNAGQTWHPMAVDLPNMVNLESGAPFSPFNRSPQIMMHYDFVPHLTLTAGIITPMQYLPVGPDGKSANYMKYGLIPEMYAGLAFKGGGFVAKAGVDFFSIRPYKTTPESVISKSRLNCLSPFAFVQYTSGSFQVKAKAILAESGEHMNLLSGYAGYVVSPGDDWSFAPQRDFASFISAKYGRKWQVMGMLGYMKLLGIKGIPDNVEKGTYWFNTSGDMNMLQAIRFTPTVSYTVGKFQFALEYNVTTCEYGDEPVDNTMNMLAGGDSHWVTNHRVLSMVKLNF